MISRINLTIDQFSRAAILGTVFDGQLDHRCCDYVTLNDDQFGFGNSLSTESTGPEADT